MKYRVLAGLLLFCSFFLYAQEMPPETEQVSEEPAQAIHEDALEKAQGESQNDESQSTENQNEENQNTVLNPAYVLERDIETSTADELADWCRSLGLDGGGGKEILAERIREFYKLEKPAAAATDDDSGSALYITIESAKTTEYFTVESVHEDYVRLRGGVSLTLKDGEILHRVKAEQILYNRTRKLLTATGNVEYIKEEGSKIESFRGEGITVNLDNWSVAFMKGVSDHSLSGGETRYRFSGEVISRSGENSTVLRNAVITNADEEESQWSIKASRLWLLPGSDWAILNAVIKVGEIPVLWLPAFYYPANEIIFHPVLGVRAREGTFVQTTTYILGRPKATSSTEQSSITSILGGGEDMDMVREGIFLRTTGAKERSDKETQLSIMADAYVNLGYYLGAELTVPAKKTFGELFFTGGIAFSRYIALDMNNYTPFFPAYDGTSIWNRSMLFGLNVPFRYRFLGTGSANFSGAVVRRADISWSIPFYSDPFIDNDFLNRSEDSNLFSQIKQATTPNMNINDTLLNSYLWQLNGRLSFSTKVMEPYVTDLSFTNIGVGVAFDTRTTNPAPALPQISYPPDRSFFYPDKVTLFSIAASISGKPVSLGKKEYEKGENAMINGWPPPISPWGGVEDADEVEVPETHGELYPPSIARAVSAKMPGGYNFSVSYQINPSAFSELKFNADKPGSRWDKQEDIDWTDLEYQLYSLKADGNIGLTFAENRNIFSHSLRFSGTSSWQKYSYMDSLVYAPASQKLESAATQVQNMTYLKGSILYNFNLRPFIHSDVWQSSNLSYTLQSILFSGAYSGNVWDLRAGKWDRDDMETHRMQLNLYANLLDRMQNFSFTADLPPEEASLSANATARFWISETTASAKVVRPFNNPSYDLISFSEVLRFTDNFNFNYNMFYDPDIAKMDRISTGLAWRGLSVSFSAKRDFGYELVTRENAPFDPLGRSFGWYPDTVEKFNPQTFKVEYQKSISINEGGRVNFNGKLETALEFNLLRYTYSNFQFKLSANFNVSRFLELSLNSYSENTVIFRYFQDTFLFKKSGIVLPGEKNIFIDLLNSFRFDDVSKRQASGFKLKSFGLDLIHHLGDWDAVFGVNLNPEFNKTALAYRFYYNFSFAIQWKPISEFKTSASYNSNDGFNFD